MAPGYSDIGYSTNNNPWMKFVSDCFGFGNTFSTGNYDYTGNYNTGSYIIYNHDGTINSGASLGVGTAYAIGGIFSQMWNAHQANKEPEIDYEKELETVTEELAKKEKEKTDQVDISIKQGDIIKTATGELENLKKELGDSTSGLIKELNDATTNYEAALKNNDSNVANLKELMELAKNKVDNKEAEIKAKQAEIDTATNLKKAADDEIATLTRPISELKNKQKEYQAEVDKQAIIDTHISGKKADKDSTATWKKDSGTEATQEMLARAKDELNKAIKKGNAEDIKKWAKQFIDMYESNSGAFSTVGDYVATYDRIKRQYA